MAVEFPRAAGTKSQKLGGSQQKKLFWKPKVQNQVSAVLVLSRGSEGESASCLSPRFWGQPAILGVAWFVDILF